MLHYQFYGEVAGVFEGIVEAQSSITKLENLTVRSADQPLAKNVICKADWQC